MNIKRIINTLTGNDTKFNVILDLDETIITTISGKIFPENKEDWKFKKGILPLLCDIISHKGRFTVYTNQAGVSMGYTKPNDKIELLLDVMDNIVEYINNETGININSILRRMDHLIIMDYNSPMRKGRRLHKSVADTIKRNLHINNHDTNVFIGDGSGLDLLIQYDTEPKKREISLLHKHTIERMNVKLSKVGKCTFRLESALKSDCIASIELDCSAYYDIDLLLSLTEDQRKEILYSWVFNDYSIHNLKCPNLMRRTNIDLNLGDNVEIITGEYHPGDSKGYPTGV